MRRLLLLILATILAPAVDAREGRAIISIIRPDASASVEMATRPADFRPLDRATVEQAVRDVAEAWNTGRLSDYLAPDMSGGATLQDTLQAVLPRDARLTVLSVQNVSTLNQAMQAGRRISTVVAVVRSQIEFNDPRVGYKRLEGLNEWTFRVEE